MFVGLQYSLTKRCGTAKQSSKNVYSDFQLSNKMFVILKLTTKYSLHLNNKNDERKGVVGNMVKEIKKKFFEKRLPIFIRDRYKLTRRHAFQTHRSLQPEAPCATAFARF